MAAKAIGSAWAASTNILSSSTSDATGAIAKTSLVTSQL
jgi:hypothetical protein